MTVPGTWIWGSTLSTETFRISRIMAALPGWSLLAEPLHEVVVDAGVAQGAAGGAGGGTDRHAEQRHEEDQPDQAAPERATRRAEAGERGLMELHVAVVLAFDDHKVVELDVVALDGLAEIRGDLLRRGQIVVGDRDQVTHAALPSC